MWNTFLKFKFKITFKITNLTIHVNSLFIYNTQLVSNYTKISMSLTWYLSWRKREQRRKNWKRDTKRIKTKEGTYPGSKLARASFIPWAISIQLLELTKPPLFTSCLINTLLLSAKVLSTSHSSYISLSLFPQRARRSRAIHFSSLPFHFFIAMARERKFVSFVLGVSFAEASLSLFCLWDESDSAFSSLFHPLASPLFPIPILHRYY